jgi:simple sugar transport system substrate-binding protein
VAVLAGCGGTTRVREPTVVVTPGQSGEPPPTSPRPSGGVRIAVVTHGQASSPFWAIVRNGVEAAARQMDVVVNYRAPDVYSVERMAALIDQAVASHPDGLVVSIPEPGLAPAIRRAVRAGIPVVSINSGSNVYRRLGVLAHVGQPEERAGFESGKRMAAAGARRMLCVNQQIGNQGLDARCRGLARAMRAVGGRSRVFGVDDQSPAAPRRIADAIRRGRIDGVLTLNATSAIEAVKGARQLHGTPARRSPPSISAPTSCARCA